MNRNLGLFKDIFWCSSSRAALKTRSKSGLDCANIFIILLPWWDGKGLHLYCVSWTCLVTPVKLAGQIKKMHYSLGSLFTLLGSSKQFQYTFSDCLAHLVFTGLPNCIWDSSVLQTECVTFYLHHSSSPASDERCTIAAQIMNRVSGARKQRNSCAPLSAESVSRFVYYFEQIWVCSLIWTNMIFD